MAIGDPQDMFSRFKRDLVPWFGQTPTYQVPAKESQTPILDALVVGVAATDSYIYELIQDSDLQTRIKTATGFYLDLISQDYFGNTLPRRLGESDFSFRHRILVNLFPVRCTRYGLQNIITNLTGFVPTMIEGSSTINAGCYDVTFFYDKGFGYGDFVTSDIAYTGTIYATLPQPLGFNNICGIGQYDGVTPVYNDTGYFGYDFYYNNAYIDLSNEIPTVTTQDLVYSIENSKVYATHIFLYVDGIYYPGNPI